MKVNYMFCIINIEDPVAQKNINMKTNNILYILNYEHPVAYDMYDYY